MCGLVNETAAYTAGGIVRRDRAMPIRACSYETIQPPTAMSSSQPAMTVSSRRSVRCSGSPIDKATRASRRRPPHRRMRRLLGIATWAAAERLRRPRRARVRARDTITEAVELAESLGLAPRVTVRRRRSGGDRRRSPITFSDAEPRYELPAGERGDNLSGQQNHERASLRASERSSTVFGSLVHRRSIGRVARSDGAPVSERVFEQGLGSLVHHCSIGRVARSDGAPVSERVFERANHQARSSAHGAPLRLRKV